jgi:hypothetical protein
MRVFVFSIAMLFATSAKPQASIEGTLKDSTDHVIPFVSVSLVNGDDSSLVKGSITDENGFFRIEKLFPGKYILYLQAMNYKKETIIITLDSLEKKIVNQKLSGFAGNLKEVEIISQKPLIEHLPDRVVINVENSIVSTGSSVFEILERSPGVHIDVEGNVSLKGKEGVAVWMDGKPLNITGDQLATYLKTMSSSVVEKIDLISNPSAKYDAEGTAGIIDIRTKKEKKNGINLSVYSTYTQGRYPKLINGLNFNSRTKKMNWFGSYDYSYRKEFYDLHLDRTFYSEGIPDTRYIQHNYVVYPYKTHTARIGTDYFLSSKSTIGLLLFGTSTRYESSGSSSSNAYNGENVLQYYYNTQSVSNEIRDNGSVNLNFKSSIDTTGGQVSADLDYATYNSPISQYIESFYTDPAGNQYQPPAYVNTDVKARLNIYSGKVDFSKTVAGSKFEAGLKSSYVNADNDKVFYNTVNNIQTIDSGKTNHFLYDENINAAYLSIGREFKNFSFQLGLRTEQTIIHGDQVTNSTAFSQNYTQFFPNASLQYKPNDINDFTLGFNRRINRPSYQSLNPFIIYVDPTFWRAGNAYLQPEYSQSVEFGYSHGEILYVNAYYSHSLHNIGVVLLQDDVRKLTIQTEENMKFADYYGLNVTLQLKLLKIWNSNTTFSMYNGNYAGFQQGESYERGNTVFDIYSTNSLLLPANFSAELTLNYHTKEVYNIIDLESKFVCNLGIKKSLLEKRLTCKLSFNDIFHAYYAVGTIRFNYIDETFARMHDTRTVTISLTYVIGKGGNQSRRQTGAEEEKQRAGEKVN